MPRDLHLDFDHRYALLPKDFYTKMPAEGIAHDPWLIHANLKAGRLIGLKASDLRHTDFAAYFSGNKSLPGAQPLAMVYSGHQFGQWAGQLGDGRALLLGQVRNKKGELWDVQLKGGGKTPYSRFGDGRAVLRSSIREYLCSEAMHALGIPTTRALSIVGTGRPVLRETLEPGAVLTRLSPSHVRFGHFQHFHYAGRPDLVKILADHVIAEHFPALINAPDRHLRWLAKIVKRTAEMIAMWQSIGFAHGVMNTDNMSVLGLTLDYGPFGFMENFDPAYICNHSDTTGRYAYDQQPSIGLWNLYAFAHVLQSLAPKAEAVEILKGYEPILSDTYQRQMRRKLGLKENSNAHDRLWLSLVELMALQEADYTLSFRHLAESFNNPEKWLGLFADRARALKWLEVFHAHHRESGLDPVQLNKVNPKFVLRNWVAEVAIRAAEDEKNYTVIDQLLNILQSPYEEHPEYAHFAAPAPESYRTLCVSCSS